MFYTFWKRTGISLVLVLLFVEAMLFVSSWTNEREILFPEAAALAIGCWVFKEERWIQKHKYVCILPTVAAMIGVGVGHLPISLFMKEWLALVLIVFMLYALQASIGPCISAGVLPLVLGIQSWVYVLSVCILTFLVMLGARISRREFTFTQIECVKPKLTPKLGFLLMAFAFLSLCSILPFQVGIVPPLMVVAYEWIHRLEMTRFFALRHVLLLTMAAVVGSVFHHVFWQLNVLVGLMSVLAALVLMIIIKVKVAPALAISLLPLVLGELPVWEFPLMVLMEGCLLLELVILYQRVEPKLSPTLLSFKQVGSK